MTTDDDLDIRGGGVVAIDTESLAAAADRYALERAELDDVHEALRAVAGAMCAVSSPFAVEVPARAQDLAARCGALGAEAAALASGLRDTAAVFEDAELRARRAAADAAGDTDLVARIDARRVDLAAAHPGLPSRSAAALAAYEVGARSALVPQALAEPFPPPFAVAAGGLDALALRAGLVVAGAVLVDVAGLGVVPRGAELGGSSSPVALRGHAVRVAAAPGTLAAAAGRIPSSDRVRVERYAMPDGSRRFALYVAGTRSWTSGGVDPWDMGSNVRLYTGERAASYQATQAALREAGARPGDAVYAFGHSQGAMIVGRLALEGGYDTRMLVTAGSPVQVDAGPATLTVELRHTDDPVSALAAGGSPVPVGAPGSFVAERTGDPLPGLQDLRLAPHHLDRYADTARMLDASADPRMGAVRDRLHELSSATRVDGFEFDAERAR